MLLVLIRHSIAEDLSEDKKDHFRDLTPEGVELFVGAVSGLLPLLQGHGDIEIWHSPTARTSQTAEILQKSLPESVCREMDFIATNNFESFARTVKKSAIPEVLLVVGHEPGMSIWSKMIADVHIKFSKGACAGFKIKNKNRLTGKMEFFLQPSALIRLKEEMIHEN